MAYRGEERRKYQRFDLETRIHFYINYKLITKVKFRVIGERRSKAEAVKCVGITRNISVEGLRFSSEKKLKKDDRLYIELYLPRSRKPIPMTGAVEWSKKVFPYSEEGFKFDTGVRLLTVKGRSVARSIHIDRKYHEPWSIVLDSVLGGFQRSLHRAMVRAKAFIPDVILKRKL